MLLHHLLLLEECHTLVARVHSASIETTNETNTHHSVACTSRVTSCCLHSVNRTFDLIACCHVRVVTKHETIVHSLDSLSGLIVRCNRHNCYFLNDHTTALEPILVQNFVHVFSELDLLALKSVVLNFFSACTHLIESFAEVHQELCLSLTGLTILAHQFVTAILACNVTCNVLEECNRIYDLEGECTIHSDVDTTVCRIIVRKRSCCTELIVYHLEHVNEVYSLLSKSLATCLNTVPDVTAGLLYAVEESARAEACRSRRCIPCVHTRLCCKVNNAAIIY